MRMLENCEQRAVQAQAPNGTAHDQTDDNRIRLVLVDDHGLFRASLARLLASKSGLDVIGECGTPGEALEILSKSPVDIILLDSDFGTERANDFISASRKSGYQGRFLIVAGTTDVASSATALKLGASGIFLKSEAPELLVQAIRLVATGGVWVDPKIIGLLADQCLSQPRRTNQNSGTALAGREQRVLLGIMGGLKNSDIARGMGVSESSVKNVLQVLFNRTGVRTRSQLVRLVLEGSLENAHQLVNRRVKTDWFETPADVIPRAGKQSIG
jgi:DNA-binding NarL/FixJ family response regulator